ncbi:transglycosylase SLT domain-containing protein [Bradyrhizobium sp. Tv2a-2]|uniref:transglycosylase SLT domain-containing protein n=1 Tax=Bradyrhizobium sp. Tv2a-2 TaxID=113395 RepID=UPI0003FF78D0|nr:transglycosylase SLT domain-containing protein [Bradyrhizobium sp. Tv2a-2]
MSVDTSNATAATGLPRVSGAIKQASNSTGASFEYLLATAKMESDFNPSAGASTSSARGLYQFIDQTWLATVKEAAGELGYGQYADAITKTSSGEYVVGDSSTRQAIMKLRDDPAVASAMAGALTQSNSFQLTGMIGRRPTDGELYMAHFMGVGGAAKLITSAEDNPQANAARMFPSAAAANHSIFYDRSGNARSVSDVYSVLNARYAGAANSSATQAALAVFGSGASASASVSGSAVTPAVASAVYLSTFPDVHASAAASSANASSAGNPQPNDPMFRSLFQAEDGAQTVSPTVQALWGKSSSLTSNAAASGPASAASSGNTSAAPLDLFSDRNGTFSG